ncbi:MAG: M20 family metallopeptidase [Candidatus Micrarchaeota archaeon]
MSLSRRPQHDVLEILKGLVETGSVSGREERIAARIGDALSASGFDVRYQAVEGRRSNIFARKGEPSLLFFGHMDTVPPVDSWAKNPLRLTVEGDRAYGLGAWDMKGGLAAILHAAQGAKDMAVLVTVDEEEISKGGWKAIGDKGFFKGINGIISAEAGNEPGTYGGARHISYGRQGRKAFHLVKELGAGHAATAGQDWVDWLHSCMHSMPKTASRIVVRRFCASSRGLSVPDKAEMDVDVLIHPSEKGTDFQGLLSTHFGAPAGLKKRQTPYLEPYSFENHPFISRVAGIVQESLGEPSLHIGSSVGDENALALLGIPIAIIGPEGRNEHRADEWVSVKSLREVAGLYSKLLERLG